jgi:hypothetical protein
MLWDEFECVQCEKSQIVCKCSMPHVDLQLGSQWLNYKKSKIRLLQKGEEEVVVAYVKEDVTNWGTNHTHTRKDYTF